MNRSVRARSAPPTAPAMAPANTTVSEPRKVKLVGRAVASEGVHDQATAGAEKDRATHSPRARAEGIRWGVMAMVVVTRWAFAAVNGLRLSCGLGRPQSKRPSPQAAALGRRLQAQVRRRRSLVCGKRKGHEGLLARGRVVSAYG
jgi:hypothetical protein